ncbi:MAG: efflux RND transporter permease subunit [Gammaproteobacteria bacterium]|nr:efflux RND transporter permease subunit [Gammaproteobacteria bacterium]
MAETGQDSDVLTAHRGVVAWFGRNPVAAYVLLILIFTGGLLSFNFIPVETFPKYDPGVIRIEVPYPGATPVEVEEDVVKRIEESLVGEVGISRFLSSSRYELGVVDAEIDDYADPVDVINSVRTAVERIEDFPPGNADQPEVRHVVVTRNVLTLAMSSDVLDSFDLRRASESLRESLLLLSAVANVELFGTRDQEIQIEVSEETLRQYGLSVQDLVQVIRTTSVNITGGELQTDTGEIVMSTLAKRDFADEFADVVVISKPDGSFVRLGEIAELRDGLLERHVETTLDGSPTVLLRVLVVSGTSPQEASAEVREFLSAWQPPEGTRLQIWEDDSLTVIDSINVVIQNGVYGLILVFLTLILVFDLRTGSWVTIGVPIVFVGSLIFFPLFGISINVITLFAFFILIALVVDDSIVVSESVATARSEGLSKVDSSITGTLRVHSPLIIAALTTMVAFAALIPLQGVIGQMFVAIPIVVGIVMLLSLIEAFLVLPGHLAKGEAVKSWPISIVQDRLHASMEGSIESRIVPLISWSVRRPFWPPIIVLAVLLGSASVLYTGWVAWSPSLSIADDQSIQADLVLPINLPIDDVAKAADRVVAAAAEIDQELGGDIIDGTIVVIGRHLPLSTYADSDPLRYRTNRASVQLRLNRESNRAIYKDEIRFLWQQKLADLSLEFPTRRSRPAGTVSYALLHEDVNILEEAAMSLLDLWSETEGVTSLDSSLQAGNRRLEVTLNTAGHAAGLTPAILATQLRDSFYGAEAQRVQRGREEVLVMVRYPSSRRIGYSELSNERIHLPGSRDQVPLHTVANIHESGSQLNRLRIDGHTAVVVTASLAVDAELAGGVLAHTEDELIPQLKARFPSLEARKHGDSRDIERLSNTLLVSVPVAFLIIYCLISSFLRSFIQPLLVLAGIPVAFVGAVTGHLLLGYEFTITSLFGLIAVSGVVINDTILLMKRYNEIRGELVDVPEIAAISAATRQRARAILLTSFTTVIGLLPILFSQAEAIQFLIPLVVSLVFGLIFAGVGLLFLLPSVLMIVELVKVRLHSSMSRLEAG